MTDTTSILDLPTDPAGGGGGNVSINISETAQSRQQQSIPQTQPTSSQPQMSAPAQVLDQTTINQIISGLQQASVNGMTQLPSRDIPMNTEQLIKDPYIQPNYLPPPSQVDYISNSISAQQMVSNYNSQMKNSDTLDNMYEELQTPILLAVMFFFFQLPFFKKILFNYIPGLFNSDGNYGINGYVFMSIAFGLLYYILNKIVNQFNAF